MTLNELVYNGNLCDQLTMLERIEHALNIDHIQGAREQIAFERQVILRKLNHLEEY